MLQRFSIIYFLISGQPSEMHWLSSLIDVRNLSVGFLNFSANQKEQYLHVQFIGTWPTCLFHFTVNGTNNEKKKDVEKLN